MIHILNTLTKVPNIKVCPSSRPWNVFKGACRRVSTRNLALEDLTRSDTELYVRNKLENHPGFRSRVQEDGSYLLTIYDIVGRSQGIFLWVFFVVRSLREGLTNGDSIERLEARLQRIPTDLEKFFEHILDQVDDVYQE